jgi:hypothetical protein
VEAAVILFLPEEPVDLLRMRAQAARARRLLVLQPELNRVVAAAQRHQAQRLARALRGKSS